MTANDPEAGQYPTLNIVHERAESKHSTRPIHVATVNVRYDGQRDRPVPIPPSGAVNPPEQGFFTSPYSEQPWAIRRSRLVDALLSTGELDIVGFQEVYESQLKDLAVLLGPSYGHVGVGRDDGKSAGEYSPIFYSKSRYSLLKWKTIWLSPKPDEPGSIGWDAGQTRIATLLSLQDRNDGHLVHAVCTHYDDRGVKARAHSSLLIRQKVWEFVDQAEANYKDESRRAPVLLFGDFNSPPEEDGYKNITSFAPIHDAASYTFIDAYASLHQRAPGVNAQSRPYGPADTYTGFSAPGREATKRIDFVMMAADDSKTSGGVEIGGSGGRAVNGGVAAGRGGWTFTQYACVDNWVEGRDIDGWHGRWSDHRAVRATLSHF